MERRKFLKFTGIGAVGGVTGIPSGRADAGTWHKIGGTVQVTANLVRLPRRDSLGVRDHVAAGGSSHSILLRSDGQVFACGRNNIGQLGNNTSTDRSSFGSVTDLSNAVAVAAGGSHNLVLRSDGQVFATGQNSLGQLGDNTTTRRSSFVAVPDLSTAVAVAAGSSHSLVVRADGQVFATGQNSLGQLGDTRPLGEVALSRSQLFLMPWHWPVEPITA